MKLILTRIIPLIVLLVFYVTLYKLLIPHINAFGCMDDCNNFVGGYFLLHGKMLFSQIFFNHAPFMAHLSAFVQWATHPSNLHELILRHRQFILIFGLISEIILLLRFGSVVLRFAFLYELTKFYLAGDRFLGEGLIVYPLCYMLGITFNKFFKKKLYAVDYLLSAVGLWFVSFTREPYIPVALLLFIALLWGKDRRKVKVISGIIVIAISLWTLFSYNFSDLVFNMITVNKTTLSAENADSGVLGVNIYKVFLYPFIIFFQGEWNFVRYIEMGLSSVFLLCNTVLWKVKKWQWILFLWTSLALSNFRLVRPGHEFYGAFHLLPWFAMTIFATVLMMKIIVASHKKTGIILFLLFFGVVGYLLLSKGSYVHDRVDQQTEFITNYGNVLQVGNVVAALSTPKNTLFVDGFDDAIYLVAKRYSPYRYSWYTSLMPQYKKYTDARIEMFRKTPPDFYYGSCPKETYANYLLPDFVNDKYERLYNLQSPSCLWVRKDIAQQITPLEWQKAGESLYYLHPTSR